MQETESMDLKHSDTLDSVAEAYIPNSKSTDLIKPSKSGNLEQKPGEQNMARCIAKASKYLQKLLAEMRRKKIFFIRFSNK